MHNDRGRKMADQNKTQSNSKRNIFNRRNRPPLIFAVLSLALILSYQNCSKVKIESTLGGVMESQSTGTPIPGPAIGLPGGECKIGEKRLCKTDEGYGEQECGADSLFRGCILETCKSGYSKKDGSCLKQICESGISRPCPLANGAGAGKEYCAADGLSYGSCTDVVCNSGFIPQGNGCVANPTCTASFNVTQGSVNGVTTTLASTLSFSAPLGAQATYNCNAGGPSGNFPAGASGSVNLNFGYPSTCTVSVTRSDNTVATCTANIDVTCSGTIVQNLYNSTTKIYTPTQDEVAHAGVDAVSPYSANINFGPSQTYQVTRFSVTNASRWCAANAGAGSVGILKVPIVYNVSNTQIDLTRATSVECRSNITQTLATLNNVCKVEINNKPPLETFAYNYSRPSACGTNHATISNNWLIGPSALQSCGTQDCLSMNQGFKWGILTEAGTGGYNIVCSRADQ